jgi:hypothetical protein
VISPTHRPLPDNTKHSQETDIHVPGGIRTRNSSKRAAADPRLRPRYHLDRWSREWYPMRIWPHAEKEKWRTSNTHPHPHEFAFCLLFTNWNLSPVLRNSGFQLQTSGIDKTHNMHCEDEKESDFYFILIHHYSIYFELRIRRKRALRNAGPESKAVKTGLLVHKSGILTSPRC